MARRYKIIDYEKIAKELERSIWGKTAHRGKRR